MFSTITVRNILLDSLLSGDYTDYVVSTSDGKSIRVHKHIFAVACSKGLPDNELMIDVTDEYTGNHVIIAVTMIYHRRFIVGSDFKKELAVCRAARDMGIHIYTEDMYESIVKTYPTSLSHVGEYIKFATEFSIENYRDVGKLPYKQLSKFVDTADTSNINGTLEPIDTLRTADFVTTSTGVRVLSALSGVSLDIIQERASGIGVKGFLELGLSSSQPVWVAKKNKDYKQTVNIILDNVFPGEHDILYFVNLDHKDNTTIKEFLFHEDVQTENDTTKLVVILPEETLSLVVFAGTVDKVVEGNCVTRVYLNKVGPVFPTTGETERYLQ
jgi:hypothetical protein